MGEMGRNFFGHNAESPQSDDGTDRGTSASDDGFSAQNFGISGDVAGGGFSSHHESLSRTALFLVYQPDCRQERIKPFGSNHLTFAQWLE
jgi:hypothetical protein